MDAAFPNKARLEPSLFIFPPKPGVSAVAL